MITSIRNPRVKYARKLYHSKRFRWQENLFVAEGTRWLVEAVQSQLRIDLVLYTDSWAENKENRRLLDNLNDSAAEVSPEVMAVLSEQKTPEGVVTILPIEETVPPKKPSLLLIVDGVSDPGNLGALFRSAAASGSDGVVLGPGCVDAYHPRVVRGSMGGHLHIGLWHMSWSQITSYASNLSNWIAAAGDHISYDQVDWTLPSSLIVGSEAAGTSSAAGMVTDNRVCIPMCRSMDSLNVAVAAGIILFEANRQRRMARTRKVARDD